MNKKGVEGVKLILYYMGGVLIGAIVLVFLVVQLPKSFLGSTEDIMAKDIALTIMTVSASPTDMVLKYTENTENYEIKISNEEVKVSSDKGSGRYSYYPMKGIEVKDAIITNKISIPIIKKDKIVYFGDDEEFTDVCANYPIIKFDDKLKVKIIVDSNEQGTSKELLGRIIEGLKLRTSTDSQSRILMVDDSSEALLIIVLKTSTDENLKINYYNDPKHPESAGYQRISCYIEKSMKDNYADKFKEIESSPFLEEKIISLDFGNPDNMVNDQSVDFDIDISKKIYESMMWSISK